MSSPTLNAGRSAAKRRVVKRAGGGNGSANLKTTRLDPTRTVMMRKALTAELRRRFARLKALIVKLVVGEDAFGADRMRTFNSFCPTGEGGGVDPSCSPGTPSDDEILSWTPNGSNNYQPDPAAAAKRISTIIKTALYVPQPVRDAIYKAVKDHSTVSSDASVEKIVESVQSEHPKTTINQILKILHYGMENGGLIGGSWTQPLYQMKRKDLVIPHSRELKYYYRLGATTNQITTNAGRWYGQPDREKVKLFAEWLKKQMGKVVADKSARDVLHKYALEGMKKGAGRAFDDVRKGERAVSGDSKESMDFYNGSRDQFLRESFRQPVAVQRVEALAGRSFDDLENITTDTSARMSRTLLDGLVQGNGARELARELTDDVDIGRNRAEVIARTEIIRAHAEGQLQAMEEMGVAEVGVEVEWSTAGDLRVCPECEAMEGTIYSIEEARGVIPLHPNCRCAWLPANVGEPTQNRRHNHVHNSFCATGEGGGVDPTCSPGGSSKGDSIKEPWEMSKDELTKAAQGGKVGPYERNDIKDNNTAYHRSMEEKVNAVMQGTKPVAEVSEEHAQQLIQQDVPGLSISKLEGSEQYAVYTDKAAFDRLNKLYKEPWSAKGSAEMGRALGYSEKDIAAFYAADNFELYHLAREEHGMVKNRWVTLESDQRVYIDDETGGFMPGGPDSEPAQKGNDYWGNKAKQPYYRPGPNPTVDNVITRDGPKGKEVLLIRRADKEGVTERGKWALPGGFHDTDAKKGERWKPGRETARDAALRELAEETGLSIKDMVNQLKHVGVYEGGGRDPRDNNVAWSKSTAFQLHLTGEQAQRKVRGTDDADKAKWIPVKDVHKMKLAFDHSKILRDAGVTHNADMTLEELYTNAFCPTGEGGGIDPTCGKGTIAEQSILALHDKLVGKGSGKLVETIKTNYGKLPQSVRTVVEAGVKTAFTGWIANQALAEQIAKEQGLNDHDAAKLRATLVAADIAAYKPAAVGLAFAGPVASALSWVVPPVTGAYLLTSAATSPFKTLKAAYKLVKKFHDDHTDVLNLSTT